VGSDDDGTELTASFLLGYRGSLYGIDCDFNVYQPAKGYQAIGCGDNPALGALYATRKVKDPRRRVLEALHASAEFCSAVRPPFTVLNSRDSK